jgi:hypothetical protein
MDIQMDVGPEGLLLAQLKVWYALRDKVRKLN